MRTLFPSRPHCNEFKAGFIACAKTQAFPQAAVSNSGALYTTETCSWSHYISSSFISFYHDSDIQGTIKPLLKTPTYMLKTPTYINFLGLHAEVTHLHAKETPTYINFLGLRAKDAHLHVKGTPTYINFLDLPACGRSQTCESSVRLEGLLQIPQHFAGLCRSPEHVPASSAQHHWLL